MTDCVKARSSSLLHFAPVSMIENIWSSCAYAMFGPHPCRTASWQWDISGMSREIQMAVQPKKSQGPFLSRYNSFAVERSFCEIIQWVPVSFLSRHCGIIGIIGIIGRTCRSNYRNWPFSKNRDGCWSWWADQLLQQLELVQRDRLDVRGNEWWRRSASVCCRCLCVWVRGTRWESFPLAFNLERPCYAA